MGAIIHGNWRAAGVAAAVWAAVAGCVVIPVPHTRVHQAAREGRVVDALTGAPLEGAVVTSLADGGRTCRTDAAGWFRLPPVRRWHGAVMYCLFTHAHSLWPTHCVWGRPRTQSIRVEAPGYAPRDEDCLDIATVEYRAFGEKRPGGGLRCPVETAAMAFPPGYEVRDGLAGARAGSWIVTPGGRVPLTVKEWLATAGGAAIRLWPEEFRREAAVPFSLCFDLEEEDAPPRPDGLPPPKARVLWFGGDAPVEVLFAEPPPSFWKAHGGWLEQGPFWLSKNGGGHVEITLDDGLPARFAVFDGPAGRQAARDAAGEDPSARRRAEIGEGKAFRIRAWEVFGRDAAAPGFWPSLGGLDGRIAVR